MTGYGPLDILWLDGGQVRPPEIEVAPGHFVKNAKNMDIDMPRLAAMARSHQPGLIIVDRTVGGRYENYRTPEQEVPEKPLPYAWETCMTMGDAVVVQAQRQLQDRRAGSSTCSSTSSPRAATSCSTSARAPTASCPPEPSNGCGRSASG